VCKDEKDIKDRIADAFRKNLRSAGHALSDLAQATAKDPFDLRHGLAKLDKQRQEEELRKKLAQAVTYRKATAKGKTPQVHVLEGQGLLGTDTVVVDKGQEYGEIVAGQATVDGRKVKYYDVSGSPVALINTGSAILDWLDDHGEEFLLNSDVFAEYGSSLHVMTQMSISEEFDDFMNSLPPISIGVVVSDFSPLDRNERYEVINPIVAAVSLLGSRAASLGGSGVTAAMPAPTELAEHARTAGELAKTAVEQIDSVRELVGGSEDGTLSVGERLYLVELHQTGKAPEPHGVPSKSVALPCDEALVIDGTVTRGVRLSTVADTIKGLIASLPGK
jgi:hypothetical protein